MRWCGVHDGQTGQPQLLGGWLSLLVANCLLSVEKRLSDCRDIESERGVESVVEEAHRGFVSGVKELKLGADLDTRMQR